MMKRRVFNIVGYLDDFGIFEPNHDRCLLAINTLFGLLRQLGFSFAWDKVVLWVFYSIPKIRLCLFLNKTLNKYMSC